MRKPFNQRKEKMATQYVQLANDHSGQSCPHLDLNWPTTGVDVAKTALGSSGTMAGLQTAMANQYYRLLGHSSDMVSYNAEGFTVTLMLTYELQRLTSLFVFRSQTFSEGQRLRLVHRNSAELYTLESALAHIGVGTIVGTLTDDYSTLAARQALNQALSTAGLPICVWAA